MTLYLPGFENEYRDPILSQWYTPPWLASRLWRLWADDHLAEDSQCVRVLEPAAGQGALIKPLLADPRISTITAIDIDPRNCEVLAPLARDHKVEVVHGNFLELEPWQRPYHLVLQNPPYEDNQDVEFILHSFFFAPFVCGIYRAAIFHGSERFELLWRWVDPVSGIWLTLRPQFGKGEKSDGPISDFVALLLTRRLKPRQRGEKFQPIMEWL